MEIVNVVYPDSILISKAFICWMILTGLMIGITFYLGKKN